MKHLITVWKNLLLDKHFCWQFPLTFLILFILAPIGALTKFMILGGFGMTVVLFIVLFIARRHMLKKQLKEMLKNGNQQRRDNYGPPT